MLELIRCLTDPSCTLRATDRMVVVALARHADAAGRCWPSAVRIAECTGLSERQVRSALHRLEAAGWLAVSPRPGRANVYILRPPSTQEVPATAATPAPETEAAPLQNLQDAPAQVAEVPLQPVQDTPAKSAPTPATVAPTPATVAGRTNPITDARTSPLTRAPGPPRCMSGEEAAWCELLLEEYRQATGQQVARYRLLQVARERMLETLRAYSGGGPANRQAFERARDEIRELRRYPALLANPDLSPLSYRRLLVQARGTAPGSNTSVPAPYLDRHPEFRPRIVRMSDPMPEQGGQQCAG